MATPTWHVAQVTEALACLACCAMAASGINNTQSKALAALAQVMAVAGRALFRKLTADLSLPGGFFAISALGIDGDEPEVGFEAIGIALDDLIQ